jgi:hypothetical protein
MVMVQERFNGPVYESAMDKNRLTLQLGRIYKCMIDGRWRTLEEISQITGDGESSISAQLRHLRKPKFGSYEVQKKIRGDRKNGLYEYRVLSPELPDAGSELFEQDILNDLTQDFFTGPMVH